MDPEGSEIFSFSAPGRLARKLRPYKDMHRGEFSSMVCAVLEAKLGTQDRELLNAKARATDLQIIAVERELLLLKEEKAKIDAQLRSLDLARERSQDARLRLLEKFQRGAVNGPWLIARTDVLVECDFKSAEEAMHWLDQEAEVIVR